MKTKHISIASLASLAALVVAWQTIDVPWPDKVALASENKSRDCAISMNTWSMNKERLDYAKKDLKSSPDDITYQRSVNNYQMLVDKAQRQIDLNCELS